MSSGTDIHSPYHAWPQVPNRAAGYTLLVSTPADLPVFFKVAMQVSALQNLSNCCEIIIIPDRFQEGFSEIFDHERQTFPEQTKVRLLQVGPIDRLLAQRSGTHATHWMQVVRGICETTTTHAILHDVDAFVWNSNFFETLYDCCAKADYACLGINNVWNISDLAKHGYNRINATWELTVNVEWMQQWPPAFHLGRKLMVNGNELVADNLVSAQLETPPQRLGIVNLEDSVVHFNSVICAYREFQNTAQFEDDYFRILLIRMLIDAFDCEREGYEIPSAVQLARGMSDEKQRVTYASREAPGHYKQFRKRLELLLNCGLLTEDQRDGMRSALEPFDEAFVSRQRH